jgi:hypothetical protein
MRIAGVVVGCGLVLVLLGGGVAAFMLFRSNGSGGGAPLTADPAVRALVEPRLSAVEALAASVVPTCPARRGSTAPSPAIGTPIAGWPETQGVQVECMFETSPGNATGGGFEDYGDTSSPDGGWTEFGPSGWHVDACGAPGSEDCVDYSYSLVDPRYIRIDASRRFPGGGGWAQVMVVLRR